MPEKFVLSLLAVFMLAGTATAELRDPTRPSYAMPGGNSAAPAAALSVTAVFISGERRIAVVNGQRLRVGDSVGGATVRSISQTQVSFERGGRTFSVALRNGISRQ